jgi:hypothetical protein
MFQAITPIIRSTRLCVTVCGIMHPRCCRPVAWKRSSSAFRLPAGSALYPSCNTQSSAPIDGRDHRPKHVELIGIINKPLLLHLVGGLYHLWSDLYSYLWIILSVKSKYFSQRPVLSSNILPSRITPTQQNTKFADFYTAFRQILHLFVTSN